MREQETEQARQELEREVVAEANRLHRRSAPNNDSHPRSVAREPRNREHLVVYIYLCSPGVPASISRVHVQPRDESSTNRNSKWKIYGS